MLFLREILYNFFCVWFVVSVSEIIPTDQTEKRRSIKTRRKNAIHNFWECNKKTQKLDYIIIILNTLERKKKQETNKRCLFSKVEQLNTQASLTFSSLSRVLHSCHTFGGERDRDRERKIKKERE